MNALGICKQTLIAVRNEPSETAEMTTQLLFGEPYEVINQEEKWLNIRLYADNYTGWIDAKLFSPINEALNESIKNMKFNVTTEALDFIQKLDTNENMPLVAGSILWDLQDDGSFSMDKSNYKLDAKKITKAQGLENLEPLARQFLNAPYLWGGKSLLGFDCSGLTQLCYHLIGKHIPRDASQQVSQGAIVNFTHEIKPGDLAFFENEEGNINHVGMLLNQKEIIHASGWVKIDHFDQQGIFCKTQKKYTHRLRTIKRLL